MRLDRVAGSAFVIFLLPLVASCDMRAKPSTSPTTAQATTIRPRTLVAPSSGETGGRVLAVVPSGRDPGAAGPAVVVRRADAPVTVPNSPPIANAPATAAENSADTGVALNFAGADVQDVVAKILGEILKLNYVIDAGVTGQVSFNVSRPVPMSQLLPTLEAVLNSVGATMVQNGALVRVVPLRGADGRPRAAGPLRAGRAAGFGQGTEVFPLRFVAPSDMQHVLEKLLPAGETIVADDAHRILLVQGAADDLRLAADTVRIFDIDQFSGTSMALVPLFNADPDELATELRGLFDTMHKEADGGVIRFMPVERLNAIMVISRSARQFDDARAWISRLDSRRPNADRQIYVYNLKYAKAVAAGQQLQSALTGLNVQFAAPASSASGGLAAPRPTDAAPAPQISSTALAPASPGAAAPPAADSQRAAAAAPAPQPAAPPPSADGVRLEADEVHNALLISATPRDYALVRQVLDGIDKPPLQVLVEVTVAEVVLNDTLRYGVQYFINTGGVANGRAQAILSTGTSTTGITPPLPGLALALSSIAGQPRVILEALSEVTQTKVISTPRILVLTNQTARLQVGDVVPIITQSATSTVTSTPLILNNVQYRETGVVLEVTPHITTAGSVTMDLNQSVSDVVTTTTSTIDSPTIRQRRLTSTVNVGDGTSILLGGLIQDSQTTDNAGIPYLKDIPVLGALFGTRNNTGVRTELIMLITPRVIRTGDDAEDMTSSVERQFRSVVDLVKESVLPRAASLDGTDRSRAP